ncbi:MAG: YgiT-type zinc finger protein [Verrucomicrobia bacterium]|nr:YgiT-type zinc finger protein [Verrucomicrobiota bacterium]
MSDYGYQCEWCDGVVLEKILPREIFRHSRGFVILEDAPVGVCIKCGHKYYGAKILRRVEEIAMNRDKAKRTERIPVAHATHS